MTLKWAQYGQLSILPLFDYDLNDKINSLVIDEVAKPSVCFNILAEMSSG